MIKIAYAVSANSTSDRHILLYLHTMDAGGEWIQWREHKSTIH